MTRSSVDSGQGESPLDWPRMSRPTFSDQASSSLKLTAFGDTRADGVGDLQPLIEIQVKSVPLSLVVEYR